MNGFSERFGDYRQHNQTNRAPHEEADFRSAAADFEQAHSLTRVQIHVVVSGEVSGPGFGPELVERLNRLCAASGKRLHSLQVEVVQMPVACPECGHLALYRCPRKGFLQSRLYPIFGFYPWSCTCCRRACLIRLRRPGILHAMCDEEATAARRKAA